MKTFEEQKQDFLENIWWDTYKTHKGVEEALTALLTAYDQSKWLKYPENKPEHVSTELYELIIPLPGDETQQMTTVGYWGIGFWMDYTGNKIENVIAFRSLPEPYKP